MQNINYHDARLAAASDRFHDEELLPFRYVFVLTNKCNLDCSFCFQDRRTLQGALTTDDWLSVIEGLPENSWVTLTGGEPLAFKGFDVVTEMLAQRNLRFNIISNGLLFTEAIFDKLLNNRCFRGLSISIDDLGNESRGFKVGQWERLVASMRYFLAAKLRLKDSPYLDVKTVVLDSNASQLFEIYHYFANELVTDTHGFQFLKGSRVQHSDKMFDFDSIFNDFDKEVAYERWDVLTEQFGKIGRHLKEVGDASHKVFLHPKIASLYDDDIEKIFFERRFFLDAHIDAKRYKPCHAMWESVHINADGNVFPCLAVPFGNVRDSEFSQLFSSKRARALKDQVRRDGVVPACSRCGYLQFEKN